MQSSAQSPPLEVARRPGSSGTLPAVLMGICALGILSTLLANFQYLRWAEEAQVRANSQWIRSVSDFNLEHFYKIQKEQLELRLNELAVRDDLDDLVRENYRLRMTEYAAQIDAVHRRSVEAESEARTAGAQCDQGLWRARWLMAGAIGFTLAFLLLALNMIMEIRGLFPAALVMLMAAIAICLNGILSFWK